MTLLVASQKCIKASGLLQELGLHLCISKTLATALKEGVKSSLLKPSGHHSSL